MKLSEPFIVVATQVPFGSPGTYPLSEVQADRFAFSTSLGYPSFQEEMKLIGSIDRIESERCDEVMSSKEVQGVVEATKKVHVSEPVRRYIVSMVGHLRESPMFRIQPSARATITLLKGSRALALTEGRDHVIPDDVKFLVPYVLQHRAFLTPEAISEEVTPESLLAEALEKVPVPKEK
jgi:MoxR-like ATPase